MVLVYFRPEWMFAKKLKSSSARLKSISKNHIFIDFRWTVLEKNEIENPEISDFDDPSGQTNTNTNSHAVVEYCFKLMVDFYTKSIMGELMALPDFRKKIRKMVKTPNNRLFLPKIKVFAVFSYFFWLNGSVTVMGEGPCNLLLFILLLLLSPSRFFAANIESIWVWYRCILSWKERI